MGRIHCIAAITPPRRRNPNRRIIILHVVDLHRRGVRPQQISFRQVERILRVAGWVIGREIERLKVVVVCFHLWPLGNGIAQTHEDI